MKSCLRAAGRCHYGVHVGVYVDSILTNCVD